MEKNTYSATKILEELEALKADIELSGSTAIARAKKAVLDQILESTGSIIHYQSLGRLKPKIDYLENAEQISTADIEVFRESQRVRKDIEKLLRPKRKSKSPN